MFISYSNISLIKMELSANPIKTREFHMNKQISIPNTMQLYKDCKGTLNHYTCSILTHPFFLWYDVDFVEQRL